eukprot:comp19757_c0_seq1/m.23612 comp19757_c0_seq1/g.23612  ORF comp19757_c0_seq1/g.23612 comp19757_c0_seq1/m.23612 type:complete len:634 (-) comp19757_c0_seq1:498-2399(-)
MWGQRCPLAAAVWLALSTPIFAADTKFVTVLGQRFATLDNTDPSTPTSGSCSETSNFFPIPNGWTLATDDDYARLAAKLFPFGADAVVFSSGTAFVTVASAEFGRPTEWDTLTTHGLASKNVHGEAHHAVDYSSLKRQTCMRVLITQPGGLGDTDAVKEVSDVEKYAETIGELQYAALDGVDVGMACCREGEDRQVDAYKVPEGWMLAGREEVVGTNFGQMGAGCLVASDGHAYQSNTKDPCYKNVFPVPIVLLGHSGKEWSVWWPNLDAGALRLPIIRPVISEKAGAMALNSEMSTLLLTTYDAETQPEKANGDTSLSYARKVLQDAGVKITEVGIIGEGNQPTTDFQKIQFYSGDGQKPPLFHSVVLTTSKLSYQRNDGEWASALSTTQWDLLYRYCGKNGVRSWSVYTFPGSDIGYSPKDGVPPASNTDTGFMWFVQANLAKKTYDLQGPLKMEDKSVFRYPVLRRDFNRYGVSPAVYFSKTETPFALDNMANSNDDNTPIGGIYLAHTTATRGEELHFFFASSYDVPHGQPMGKHATSWLLAKVEGFSSENGVGGLSLAQIGGVIGGAVGAGAILILGVTAIRRKIKDRRDNSDVYRGQETSDVWAVRGADETNIQQSSAPYMDEVMVA